MIFNAKDRRGRGVIHAGISATEYSGDGFTYCHIPGPDFPDFEITARYDDAVTCGSCRGQILQGRGQTRKQKVGLPHLADVGCDKARAAGYGGRCLACPLPKCLEDTPELVGKGGPGRGQSGGPHPAGRRPRKEAK